METLHPQASNEYHLRVSEGLNSVETNFILPVYLIPRGVSEGLNSVETVYQDTYMMHYLMVSEGLNSVETILA